MFERFKSSITDKQIKFQYRGNSMHSTFKPGQLLYVHPQTNNIHPGDVVVYRKGSEYIVHRINRIDENGVYTRGDDNPRDDDTPSQIKDIVGVVSHIENDGLVRPVVGGRRGLLFAQSRWTLHWIYLKLRPILGAPYRWLKSSRVLTKVWHPKVIQVKTNSSSGQMIKYIVGGKTVATWELGLKRFQCKRLYDLVIFPPDYSND